MAKKTKTAKNQTFRLIDPDAERVLLAGDFTDWQKGAIPMEKGANGLWSATVKLSPGTHNYLFIVDGEWCSDPECTARVPNPFGSQNMVRQVL
jgi:1,4-alpha-glucan branching enzyme